MLPILKNIPKDKELKNRSRPQRCRAVRSADIEKMVIVSIFVSGNDSNEIMDKKLNKLQIKFQKSTCKNSKHMIIYNSVT